MAVDTELFSQRFRGDLRHWIFSTEGCSVSIGRNLCANWKFLVKLKENAHLHIIFDSKYGNNILGM